MSDEPCNADEELGKLHSRELDRQLNAEYSAMLDRQRHNEWVDSLKADVEFQPLRDFLEGLKE